MKRRFLIAALVLIALNFAVIFSQGVVSHWQWRHLRGIYFSELRYFIQSLILLLPVLLGYVCKWRFGGRLLMVAVVLLVANAGVFLVKAQVPGSRRNQYVSACDWAVEEIRRDYRGPKTDAEPFFTEKEYHTLRRPVVDAHVARVAYLLEGRAASPAGCGVLDIPDYIVGEPSRLNRAWWTVAEYRIMSECRFGKRDFIIYKRIK